eukprot:scaffold8566_cov107-Skeletonema_marinoi.AAC.1
MSDCLDHPEKENICLTASCCWFQVDDQGFRGCVTQSMVSSEPSSYPTIQPSPSPSALPSSSPSDVPTSIPSTHPTSQPSSSPSMSPSGIPSIDYGTSCGAFISDCFKKPKNDGICKIASCCWILEKGDIAGQRECVLNSAVPSSSPSVTASYEPSA